MATCRGKNLPDRKSGEGRFVTMQCAQTALLENAEPVKRFQSPPPGKPRGRGCAKLEIVFSHLPGHVKTGMSTEVNLRGGILSEGATENVTLVNFNLTFGADSLLSSTFYLKLEPSAQCHCSFFCLDYKLKKKAFYLKISMFSDIS